MRPYHFQRVLMSQKASEFLIAWLRSNVIGRIGGEREVEVLAQRCIEDAAKEGITRSEIEKVVGPIADCVRKALRSSKDRR